MVTRIPMAHLPATIPQPIELISAPSSFVALTTARNRSGTNSSYIRAINLIISAPTLEGPLKK